MSKRQAIGIVIDYGIRIPNFVESYKQMRQQISVGSAQMSGGYIQEEDLTETRKSLWDDMRNADPEAAKFYETLPMPTDNCPSDTNPFDISYRKYFYTPEHRIQFMQEWSFNLFGTGSPINKVDVNLINVAQTKLFDVILIDRCTHTRKIGNTFAFLSRAGIFCKQVVFVNTEEELKQLKKDKNILDIWNPFENPKQIIVPTTFGEPTPEFLTWLQAQEKKVNS